eukprot:4745639-Ditylum_brightwellii.AAC.1
MWLRVSMAYKRFPNLRESFSGDLSTKVNADVMSRDFCWRPCNCNRASKVNGRCAYNSECCAT